MRQMGRSKKMGTKGTEMVFGCYGSLAFMHPTPAVPEDSGD